MPHQALHMLPARHCSTILLASTHACAFPHMRGCTHNTDALRPAASPPVSASGRRRSGRWRYPWVSMASRRVLRLQGGLRLQPLRQQGGLRPQPLGQQGVARRNRAAAQRSTVAQPRRGMASRGPHRSWAAQTLCSCQSSSRAATVVCWTAREVGPVVVGSWACTCTAACCTLCGTHV